MLQPAPLRSVRNVYGRPSTPTASPITTRRGVSSDRELRDFAWARTWMMAVCPVRIYRQAIITTALAAYQSELPRVTVALPCPHENRTWETADPNRCFVVAMQKARRLRKQFGKDWDLLAPEGAIVAEVIVYLSHWWYTHPARIGRISP